MKLKDAMMMSAMLLMPWASATAASPEDSDNVQYVFSEGATDDDTYEEDDVEHEARYVFQCADPKGAIEILKTGDGLEKPSHRYLLAEIYESMDSLEQAWTIAVGLFAESPRDTDYAAMLQNLAARNPRMAAEMPVPKWAEMPKLYNALYYHAIAKGCLDACKYTMAEYYADKALHETAVVHQALLTLSIARMNLRKFEYLEGSFTAFMHMGQDDEPVTALIYLARLLRDQDRHDEEIELWKSKQALWEGYEPYYFPKNMALALTAAGRYTEALEWYDDALKKAEHERYIRYTTMLNPLDEIRMYRGINCYRMGDKVGCAADMNEAIAHGAKSPLAYAFIGERDKALEALGDGYTHAAKAAVYYVLDDIDKAFEEIETDFQNGQITPETVASDLVLCDLAGHPRFAAVASKFKPA